MSTIAVTGATGFIGRHLTRALSEAGHRVRALTRRALGDDLATWVEGTLSSPDALARLVEGADAVVHLAGVTKALRRDDYFRDNVEGTRAVAGAVARVSPTAKLIHVSSLAAREPRLSDYAASKRASEQALRAHGDRLSLTILRPPAVYGPGDPETLRLFAMAARGWVLIPSVANGRLSLVHVADAVAAIVTALDAAPHGLEPVEFDDGTPGGHDWPAVARAAGLAVRRETRTLALPPALLLAAGAVGSVMAQLTRRPTLLSWAKAAEALHPDWVARPSALAGYHPRWNLENGFKDAVNWAVSRGLLKSDS